MANRKVAKKTKARIPVGKSSVTKRKRTGEALHVSEGHYRELFENMLSVILLIDPDDGAIVDANRAAAAYYGWSIEELRHKNITDINTLSPNQVKVEIERARMVKSNHFVFKHRRAQGEPRDVEVHSGPIKLDGRTLLYCIMIDITEGKRLEKALKESELRYRTVADYTSDWEYWIMPDGTFRYVSPSCEKVSGYTPDEFYDDPQLLARIVHPDDLPRFAGHSHRLNARGEPEPLDFRIRTKVGESRWISHVCRPVFDPDGQPIGLRASNRDITERKQMEDQVRQMALHDELTNLPNRRLFFDRLSQALSASKRSGYYGAVMSLDLDNFKPLNDTHGHGVGDLLLIEAAARLKRCLREADTAARVGGDEFAVVLSDLSVDKTNSTSQAETVAEKIRSALSEPYELTIQHDGEADSIVEHRCAASIGVALFIDHKASRDDILKWADDAMYQAKKAGGNLIRFSDSNV